MIDETTRPLDNSDLRQLVFPSEQDWLKQGGTFQIVDPGSEANATGRDTLTADYFTPRACAKNGCGLMLKPG